MKIIQTPKQLSFHGPAGTLPISPDDEITRRLAMLILGECEGPGPAAVAHQFAFSRQRYYQLRARYQTHGAAGLALDSPGPKTNYRRTEAVVRRVLRQRFLNPAASPEVITQQLRQRGQPISQRSVQRIIADYGLQKKTLHA